MGRQDLRNDNGGGGGELLAPVLKAQKRSILDIGPAGNTASDFYRKRGQLGVNCVPISA
jgi:hypothetical protein